MDKAAAALGIGAMLLLWLFWKQIAGLAETGFTSLTQTTVLAFCFVMGTALYIDRRNV